MAAKPSGAPIPDLALRDALRALLADIDGLREAPMFGCPAFFLGRRMVACVYGDRIGMKLPASAIAAALARDGVAAFRPYGKAMREWIAIEPGPGGLHAFVDLVASSVAYARELGA